MPNPNYTSVAMPKTLGAEITRLSIAEQRTKAAIVQRMLDAYLREQNGENPQK